MPPGTAQELPFARMRSPGTVFSLDLPSRQRRLRRWLCLSAWVLAGQLTASGSRALEPRSSTEPRVLREPAGVTRVVDAWGERGGVDLHFTLDYQQSWKRAAILRETTEPGVNSAGAIGQREVASFSESTSRLNLRAEVGLFRDLALIVRLPIILSSSSSLEPRALAAGALDGAPGEPLFSLPFSSPNRSGVEYLGLGVDWGILNQWRDPTQPTLLVGAEARFSIAEPMHACGPAPAPEAGEAGEVGSRRCAHPGDIDRDGQRGGYLTELGAGRLESLEGSFPATGRRAGVSRGTTALALHSVISRRFQRFEPYVGFDVLLELANDASDFARASPWQTGLPRRAGFSLGTEIVPWEVVEKFQRFSLDVRFSGNYRSAGHDYSELFDALGSSNALTYRMPNFARYMQNPDPTTREGSPSVVDPGSERVFPTGITRVEAHGAYALRLAARWQAGPYVHFDAGGGLELTQGHFLTLGRPCDAARALSAERAGPCAVASGAERRVLGAPDPSFRPEVDLPGRRFIVGTARSLEAWVGATVMF